MHSTTRIYRTLRQQQLLYYHYCYYYLPPLLLYYIVTTIYIYYTAPHPLPPALPLYYTTTCTHTTTPLPIQGPLYTTTTTTLTNTSSTPSTTLPLPLISTENYSVDNPDQAAVVEEDGPKELSWIEALSSSLLLQPSYSLKKVAHLKFQPRVSVVL